jgi:nucleoside-diphosphate-sugar epimerase
MKILVFGDGFIARNLILFLDREKFSVITVSRKTIVGQSFFDFFDLDNLRSVIQENRPDVVINTIWNTELKSYVDSPLNIHYAQTTVELAKICIQNRIGHFISFGSSAEYGESPGACDAQRTTCKPESIYAQSKFDTYLRVSGLYKNDKLRFNWIRIFQPYGFYQDVSRFIPHVIACFRADRELILEDTNSQLDWIASIDISRGIEFVLQNDTPEVLDFGTSVPSRNYDVVNMIANKMRVLSPKVQVSNLATQSKIRFVSQNSFLVQNCSPQIDLEKGIEWLVSDVQKD